MANADSHMLNHVVGHSSQNPGRLRLELTTASINSLPGLSVLPVSSDGRKLMGHRIQGLKEGSRLGGLEPGAGAAGDLTVWDIAVIYLKKVRHTGGGGLLLMRQKCWWS